MEGNELRCGNLVMIENELLIETKGEVYYVSGINMRYNQSFPDSKSVIALSSIKNIRTYGQYDEFVKPISIDENWLIKLGAKKFGKDFIIENVIIHSRKDGYVVNRKIPVLKYVHQLQNFIYANRGKELTIKL